MSRLNVTIKNQIAKILINRMNASLIEERNQCVDIIRSTHQQLAHKKYPAIVVADMLAKGVLNSNSRLAYVDTIGGGVVIVDFDNKIYGIPKSDGAYKLTGKKVEDAIYRYSVLNREISFNNREELRALQKMLVPITTYEKLIKLWPDVEPVIKHLFVSTLKQLPALNQTDLNSKFGLPVDNTYSLDK